MNHELNFSNKFYRFFWAIIYILLFKYSPSFLHKWRVFILNLFGSQIKYSAHVYPSVKIFDPRNLFMDANTCLAPNTICFNVSKILIKKNSIISQNCHLCTASRKYNDFSMRLIKKSIVIEEDVWIAADCFIGPGVTVKDKSIILARTVLLKNTRSSSIFQGNPGKCIGFRNKA